ncbi:inositol monophosphatase family protein [Micromonospora sp. NPDC005299]|uniref:inositol monophosphatase family protein n=1 Tax=Micromonospora sp. NPDC005299 TaxID=3364231 RepID=UPI0036AAE15C
MDLDDLLAVARLAADAGAEAAMRWRRRADQLTIEEKAGPDDLVSQADREAEQAIRAVLAARRPDDGVLGEEGGNAAGRSGVRWIVDPIDGTTNYLYGRPDWAVSVAAARVDGDELLAGVVAEPELGRVTEARRGGGTWSGGVRQPELRGADLQRTLIELNLGRAAQKAHAGRMIDALVPRVRDVRRGGSAAGALAQLATGRVDAVWVPGLRPWDCAAGVLLAQEVGAQVGDLTGRSPGTWPASGDVLAAPHGLWETLRELIAGAYPEGMAGH